MTSSMHKSMLAMASLLAATLLFTSCGTTFMVAADDVYGNVPSREEERRQNREEQMNQRNDESAGNLSGASAYNYSEEAAVEDTFNYDDYYDYEYSSRLRRFQNENKLNHDYYSDYYTNVYWYDANPYNYGTSIYLGYSWWYPEYTCYRPGWYMGFGYRPYSWWHNSYWDYYYYPYHSWSYNHGYYHGYNNGYWDGYRDGYWDANYDYCYNPYDRNTYTQSYYGRRTRGSSMTNPTVINTSPERRDNVAGNNSSTPSLPSAPARRTFAERYEHAVSTPSSSTATGITIRNNPTQPNTPSTPTRRTVNPSAVMESASSRLERSTAVEVNPTTPRRPVQPDQPNQPTRRERGVVNPSTNQNPQREVRQRESVTMPRASSQSNTYNKPVYDRNRGSSSYVSPRYNTSSNANPTTRTRTSNVSPASRQTSTPRTSSSSSSSYRSSGSSSSSSYRSSGSSSSSSSSSSGSSRRTR